MNDILVVIVMGECRTNSSILMIDINTPPSLKTAINLCCRKTLHTLVAAPIVGPLIGGVL